MKTRAFKATFAILVAAVLCAVSGVAMAQTGTRAKFNVDKWFNDGNPGDVTVYIECTTGDPIQSMATFSADEGPIEFIVKDFDSGELDCEIWEDEVDGYSVDYEARIDVGNPSYGDSMDSEDGFDGCRWTEIEDEPGVGDGGGDDDDDGDPEFRCDIDNELDSITVYVGKEWIDPQAGVNGEVLFAGARWRCEPVADRRGRGGPRVQGDPKRGNLWFSDPVSLGGGRFYDQDSFWFYPHWDGTTCSVSERELDSNILSDDSDCDDLEFFPGYEADLDADDNPIPACTIINTRIYAGIPTLSEYGLALLALLMLGVGFVGYRRFA